MKKLLKIINLVLLVLIYITNISCGNLTRAIIDLDDIRVVKLLQARGSLSTETKNKLLSISINLEKKYKAKKSSIFKSKQDLLHAATGGILSLIWGCQAYRAIKFFSISRNDKPYAAIFSLVNTFGFVSSAMLFHLGWTLSHANSKLKKAQEIKDLINNCPTKNESESGKSNRAKL